MLLALRINVLAKGYSGISIDTLKKYIDAFNGNSLLVASDRLHHIFVHSHTQSSLQNVPTNSVHNV